MKPILIIYLFFLGAVCYSQITSTKSLNDLFLESRELINQDQKKSIALANELLSNAQVANENEFVVKAYYLLAFNDYLMADADGVTQNLEKGIALARRMSYKEGEALCLRLLGTQYARLRFLQKSEEALQKALDILEGVESQEAYEIKGLVYNSFLILMDDNYNIPDKIIVAKKAIEQFELLEDNSRSNKLIVSASTNLGFLYTKIESYDSAKLAFEKALKYNEADRDQYLTANIYHDLGFYYQERKMNDSAIYYYEKGLDALIDDTYVLKRLELYERLYKVYKEESDIINFNKYLDLYIKLNRSVSLQNLKTAERLVIEKEENIDRFAVKVSQYGKLLFLAVVLLIVLILVLVYFLRLRKKDKKRFSIIMSELRGDSEENTQNPEKNIDRVSSTNSYSILNETEDRILNELELFEESLEFNNPDISLFNLANQVNTNTKYLSEIIKKHKGVNFNQYINELRIKYIVEKLSNNPEYLNYKISHLADESGFSSHSAFTSVFKQIKGISPSVFIRLLKDDNKNNK